MRQFRYFFFSIKAQEHYLNRMANRGYRFTACHIASYEFEKTDQDLCYEIAYIADRSASSYHAFRSMLDELHYTYFFKNVNLNYAVGKAKLRFTGHGFHMQTTKDLINRELLIIEKPKEKDSFLFTTNAEWIYYYQGVRNIFLQYVIVCLLLTLLMAYQGSMTLMILFLLATFLFVIPMFFAQKNLHDYQKEGELYE